MRPVPPTPAMPRFADTSLLMAMEPIFGDVTLDDDDWLMPPTPGPSRFISPKTITRTQTTGHAAHTPIQEEQDIIQEEQSPLQEKYEIAELTPEYRSENEIAMGLEEGEFSGGGEKVAEREQEIVPLRRAITPEPVDCADLVPPSRVVDARNASRSPSASASPATKSSAAITVAPSANLCQAISPQQTDIAAPMDLSVESTQADSQPSTQEQPLQQTQPKPKKISNDAPAKASRLEEISIPLSTECSPPAPKSALSRYLAKAVTRPAPASSCSDLKAQTPVTDHIPSPRTGEAPQPNFEPIQTISAPTDLFSPAVCPSQQNEPTKSNRSARLSSAPISDLSHCTIPSTPPALSAISRSTPISIGSSMNNALTPATQPRTSTGVMSQSRARTSLQASDTSVSESSDVVETPRSIGLMERFTGFLKRSRSSLSLSDTPVQASGSHKRAREYEEEEAEVGDDEQSEDVVIPESSAHAPMMVKPSETIQARPPQRSHPVPLRAIPGFIPLTRPSKRPFPSSRPTTTASSSAPAPAPPPRKPPVPKARPAASSAFAQAAIARLPPAGRGSTSAAGPIRIRTPERAQDLAKRRRVFESTNTNVPPISTVPNRHLGPGKLVKPSGGPAKPTGMVLTKPVVGQTPGKASKMRAAQRDRFDAMVKEKQDAQEAERRETARRREREEEEAYQKKRKETVIWAKPVPALYRRQGSGAGSVGRT